MFGRGASLTAETGTLESHFADTPAKGTKFLKALDGSAWRGPDGVVIKASMTASGYGFRRTA